MSDVTLPEQTSSEELAIAEEGPAPQPSWSWRSIGGRGRPRQVSPPLFNGHQFLAVAVFTVLVALIVPQVMTSRSNLFNTNLWMIYCIAGIGFYWMVGLAGRFAFCQTLMMALGGYTSAYVTRNLGEQWFLLGVVAAIAAAALLAFLIAFVVRKAQFFFFAIATMAVSQVGLTVFQKASSFTGPNGTTSGITPPQIGNQEYITNKDIFWLFLIVLTIVLILAAFLERSPLRRDAVAGRDNFLVARVVGVNATKIQIVLFVMGSALGGLAGALIGHWNGVISTDTFSFDLAIGIFLMLFLGGVGSMWGPVIGAAFYVALPIFLNTYLQGIAKYNTMIYGIILLVVVLAMPEGIMGGVASLRTRIMGRWQRRSPSGSGEETGPELVATPVSTTPAPVGTTNNSTGVTGAES